MRRKGFTVWGLGILLAFGLMACGTSQDTGTSGSAGADTDAGTEEEATVATEEENGAGGLPVDLDFTVNYDGIKTAKIDAGVSVHDPSIVKADGKYYIFGSHMSTAVSEDLRTWTSLGDGYKVKDQIYYELMANKEAFAYAGSKNSVIPTDDRGWHVWAPDVIYNEETGLYYLYFCTSSTWNASNLCYATSENIEGPYEWKGALIYSGFTAQTLDDTDVAEYVDRDTAKDRYIKKSNEYNFNKYPNAIDPTVLYDGEVRLWMVYGSW